MIDPTDFEKTCMEKALRPLGEIVAEIGPHKAFADLSRAQVLTLIEVIVTAYMDELSKGEPKEEYEEIPF